MISYSEAFKNLKRKKEGALAAFIVIGDPDYKTSLEIAKRIVDAGADMLELGLPFSDPIADGPSIQAADIRALNSGMDTKKVFGFIRELREHTDIPIGLLSYFNLIYQYGIEKFYIDAKKARVNSILIADMPIEEYSAVSAYAKNNGLDTVLIVSPVTDNNRLREIAKNTTGFVYVVSRLGVTGARKDLRSSTLSLIRRIRQFSGKPLCVGFGISSPTHVRNVIEAGADGAIVGSAIVDLIAGNISDKNKMLHKVYSYVKGMKKATIKQNL
ncbi:tryptophan synthase subunit alpha [Candidatus Woesearchaeota archaeon]|nr:tryptophan synthase subunit alpha [Candidatus Woesearchaeota archaeon]